MQNKPPLLIANWKMNLTLKNGVKFFDDLKKKYARQKKVKIILCPSFLHLPLIKPVKSSFLNLGAQNCFYEEKGAFTGETSPLALKELGIQYVIIGHSERKMILNENIEMINKKVKTIFKNKMCAILCIGETLKERKNSETIKSIYDQLEKSLKGINLTSRNTHQLLIAYEPIWSIGTGTTPKPEEIQNMGYIIRRFFEETYNPRTAQGIDILYGGSADSSNLKKFIANKNINGFLLGGASIEMKEMIKIIEILSNFK